MCLQYIPHVNFADLINLGEDEVKVIKQRGCLVIRDIVDDDKAISWKQGLEEFVKANPNVEGW